MLSGKVTLKSLLLVVLEFKGSNHLIRLIFGFLNVQLQGYVIYHGGIGYFSLSLPIIKRNF